MKFCRACGHENRAAATECQNCGESFDGAAGVPVAIQPGVAEQRPDGSALLIMAIVLAIVAGGLMLYGSGQPDTITDTSYGSIVTLPNNKKALLEMLAGGLFNLAVITWAVSQIVRAISFLPGKDD